MGLNVKVWCPLTVLRCCNCLFWKECTSQYTEHTILNTKSLLNKQYFVTPEFYYIRLIFKLCFLLLEFDLNSKIALLCPVTSFLSGLQVSGELSSQLPAN